MRKTGRIGAVSIIALLLIFMMSVNVFAAKTVTVLDGKISITDSGNKGSGSGTGYTASISGGITSAKSNTITITNETENDGEFSFNYSVSGSSAFTINGNSAATSGGYKNTLKSGEDINIVLTAPSGILKTAKLTMTDISLVEASGSAEVTYEFDSTLGTVTANGSAISDGDVVTITDAGVEMVANANSGATFLGWVDSENMIITTDPTYTQLAMGNKTITAIFSKSTPYFLVDKTYIHSDLSQAFAAGSTVVLMCNGTLGEGNYTIPSGKTLLIPMDSTNTVYTTQPARARASFKKPTAYRTLTLENGANITVNGAISLGGKQSANIQVHGSPVGTYGHINMKSGSVITVNNGAKLYAWGYITGAGSIIAENGATVYEDFQLRDYRGGDATTSMLNNKQGVLPMSQYYVQNIEVPLTLKAGAIENGFMSMYVSGTDLFGGDGIQTSEIPFIGPNAMFRIVSGSITKDYDENRDRLVISVDGELNMSSLELSMKISAWGGNSTIDSSKYTLPINGNITLHVNDGSVANISQNIALLPGGEINVYKGARCVFAEGVKAYIYDKDEWGGYCSQKNLVFMPINYAPGSKYTRTEAVDIKDAVIYIEGEVDASAAFVYTTTSGANIIGAEGGKVKMNHGSDTVTYQVTQSGTDIAGYPEIPITVAKLQNEDTSYVEPQKLNDCGKNFIYTNGVWEPTHTGIETVTGTPATCTKTGLTDGESCTVCGTVIKAQEEIPVDLTSHEYGEWIADGDNHKKVCACGDTVTEAHAWDNGVITTEPTHTTEGVKTYTCACGATKTETIEATADHEYDGGVVTTEPTHTTEGVKTYTCACGATKTETIAATPDHEFDGGVVTTEPTHTTEGVKTYTCACGETKTEAIEKTPGHTFTDWTKVDGINHVGVCECGEEETKAHEFTNFACALCGCDKIVTTTLYTIENGEIKINTELIWDVPEDTHIVVALYTADGKLVDATISDTSELAEMVFAAEGVAQIKVFAWSKDFGTPISIAEEITVTNVN